MNLMLTSPIRFLRKFLDRNTVRRRTIAETVSYTLMILYQVFFNANIRYRETCARKEQATTGYPFLDQLDI